VSSGFSTLSSDGRDDEGREGELADDLALVVVWASDPNRVGEVLVVPDDGPWTLGRDDGAPPEPRRLVPIRQRPSTNEARPPFDDRFLSREQAIIHVEDNGLHVKNVGRAQLVGPREQRAVEVHVEVGETVGFERHILFLCVRRPKRIASAPSLPADAVPTFGDADVGGIVGESAAAWRLRDNLAFLAGRSAHVLLLGPSGSGKELAAQCIHRLSSRRARRMIARNAATFPETLVEAELFGSAANYPNQGSPERPGLVGQAEGSTLFLDEIGELPHELQTRLLRLLDEPGEYQRLGDPRPRRANLRVVAATNRPVETLREDVAARFKLRLTLPGLGARREDIPLIARQLLRGIARGDHEIGERFLEGWDGASGQPRLAHSLVTRIVEHDYTTHVRELERLLWTSLASSRGDSLELTSELRAELDPAEPLPPQPPTADEVRAALERARGVRDRAWRELGLANRWALTRLMKKHGIA
jgi:transcriptional regulator with GAF, ATPase, and Fis domain